MSPTGLVDRPPHHVAIDDEVLDVRVRVSSAARTVRLRIGPSHPIEIIVPAGTSNSYIDEVLRVRRPWIRRKLAAVRAVEERPALLGLDRTGVAWLDLKSLPVLFSASAPAGARLAEDTLIVGGDRDELVPALERWYRREARRRLLDVAGTEAERLGITFRSLSVRDQRTRWGSCSNAANLSFNWRLVIAPAPVRAYVVVHELCHVRIPNHSKAFWRSLDAACPGWHEASAWLRDHGRELRAYAPASAVADELL